MSGVPADGDAVAAASKPRRVVVHGSTSSDYRSAATPQGSEGSALEYGGALVIPGSKPPGGTGPVTAYFISTKSVVGVGILSMPFAFQQSGIVVGVVGVAVISVVSAYCVWLIIDCRTMISAEAALALDDSSGSDRDGGEGGRQQREEEEASGLVDGPGSGAGAGSDVGVTTYTYMDIAKHAGGLPWAVFVGGTLFISQLGFLTAYFMFIGENMASVFDQLPAGAFIAIAAVCEVGLSLIKDLGWLAPASILGLGALAMAVAVIFYNFARGVDWGVASDVMTAPLEGLTTYFGIVVFAYEGAIGMCLPIEQGLIRRDQYLGVLVSSFGTISLLNILFGVAGALTFVHPPVEDVITKNMGATGLTAVVKVALCIQLVFTFPGVLFPVTEWLDRTFGLLPRGTLPAARAARAVHALGYRVALIAVTAVLASTIRNFGYFISFVGSISCAALFYIIPPVSHVVLVARSPHRPLGCRRWAQVAANALVFTLGLVAMGLAGSQSLLALLSAGPSPSNPRGN